MRIETKRFQTLYRHFPAASKRHHCVAFAFARAMSLDPHNDEKVGDLAWEVAQEMYTGGGLRRDGAYYGDVSPELARFGLEAERRDTNLGDMFTGRRRRRTSLPTVNQWLAANPDVEEAIFLVTRHAGYYRRGELFSLSARQRVTSVFVLSRYS